ncbi:hypothetical protein BFW01_g11511 [Lasiodiplodia theobromae]|nr:hypothetical protein BFW01_g11511 [Lasiodiplodia theobromae]
MDQNQSGESSYTHPTSHLAHRPRQLPNQIGFPPPVGHLPAVRQAAPVSNLAITNEKTRAIPQVPANINLRQAPPQEYVTSNSLRTQYGSGGQRVRVATNYVEIKKAPSKLITYTVTVHFAENGDSRFPLLSKEQPQRRRELRRVFESLKHLHPLHSRTDWSTDLTNVWSVKKLFDGTELTISDIKYFKSNGHSASVPRVTFTLDGELDLSRGHLDLIEAKTVDGSTDAGIKARALNGIVSNFMCLSTSTPITQIGANRFFLTDAYEDLGPDCPFFTLRGYFLSIRPGNDRMLLNINTTTSAFFKPILVSQFFRIMLQSGMKEWMIKGLLRKQVVRITYERPIRPGASVDINGEAARRKQIAGFGEVPEEQTFLLDGKETTVFDYFKDSPGCPLRRSSTMPCVNVGANRPGREQWIPAEFLELDFPQLYRALLPSTFTDRMMSVALRGPAANANLIVNEGLEEIGFEIDDKLIDVPARILDGPKLQYAARKGKAQPVSPQFASWNLVDQQKRKHSFAVPSVVPRIGILTLGQSRVDPQRLARELLRVLKEHGVEVTNASLWHKVAMPRPDQEGSYVASMKDVILNIEEGMRENAITVVLLPKQDADLYAALKTNNLLQNDQTLSNIALKFSLKTGGRPHQIAGGICALGNDTMIIGADVTHPSADARAHCPSVAAAVGSFDEFAINYTGSMRLQKSRQEIIEDIGGMTTELLNMYGAKNKKLPSNIVYYRDGVSETQYDAIRKMEITSIEQAWMDLKKSGKPASTTTVKITCIVVGKRHHTRFFPKSQKDADRSNNVKPGLVVDSVITHPYCFDFFLQSHAAVKGTARSAHYFLLRNDMKLDAKQLQELTHALCYTYGTATKGISYCAPAYLADKLCERGRHYIRDWLLGRPGLSSMIPPYSKSMAPTVQDHERLVARHLNVSRPFNIWETAQNGRFKGRKNPWHQNLDDKMFWV